MPPNRSKVRPLFTTYTPEELDMLPVAQYLVGGVLKQSKLAALYGSTSSFKTFVALDLALCLASGTGWHGRAVRQGPVLYVCAEGSDGISQRIQAWAVAHHHQRSLSLLRVLPEAPQLLEPEELHRLLATIHALPAPPVLVVLDTLARVMGEGDENSAQDMNRIVSAADRIRHETGGAVLLVHHTGRAGHWRGSTAIPAALDTAILVSRHGALTARLRCEKQRDCAAFADLTLYGQVVPLAENQTSLAFTAAQAAAAPAGGTPAARDAAAVARALLVRAGERGLTTEAWLAAAKECHVSRATLYRVRAELLRANAIRVTPNGSIVAVLP